MIEKLKSIKNRYEELSRVIADPEVIGDQNKWRELMKEHSNLEPIASAYDEYICVQQELADLSSMENDPEMAEMVAAEREQLQEKSRHLLEELKVMLLPKDPDNDKNVVMEIRAGTGGEEAALFGSVLLRMYTRYCERHNYKMEMLSSNMTELGGVKEVVFGISGKGAYGRLKYESGVHRVQRIPETESGGRIHTSAATVAVLPEAEDIEVDINPNDLRIDVYRSGGHGGQSVNTTDSAVRITHLPSGLVVICQNEKSQLKNKEQAMKVLKSRLLDMRRTEQDNAMAQNRKAQVGSGDRSERIRTYNYPQGRVTDHRISVTLYNLEAFLDGDCDGIIEALVLAERTSLLSGAGQNS
ncbi:MAG: peptide chain release factor 1 [Christensenellales bacterium]